MRLQIDSDWKFEYSDVVEVEVNNLPKEFAIEQNFPNSFYLNTSIEYSIPSSEYVILKVYDILGRETAQLVKEKKDAGGIKLILMLLTCLVEYIYTKSKPVVLIKFVK